MKKSLLLIIVCFLLVAVGGVAIFNNTNQVYRYENSDIDENFSIEKSMYKKSVVRIYCEGYYTEKALEVVFYDENFEEIKEGIKYSWEDACLVVRGKNASKVSGMKVELGDLVYYQVRYLDSSQFAFLAYYWADDYGYMVEGDREAYYTEEELAEQAERKEKAEKQAQENFKSAYAYVEGDWKTTDEKSEMHFYIDESKYMYEECEEEKDAQGNSLMSSRTYELSSACVREENGAQCVEAIHNDGGLQKMILLEIVSDTELKEMYGDKVYFKYEE